MKIMRRFSVMFSACLMLGVCSFPGNIFLNTNNQIGGVENITYKLSEAPESIQYQLKDSGYGDDSLIYLTAQEDAAMKSGEALSYLRVEDPVAQTGRIELFSAPVKYIDSDGKTQFIDLGLSAVTESKIQKQGYYYRNAANQFQTYFGKTADVGVNMNNDFSMSAYAPEAPKDEAITSKENGAGKVSYSNAFGTSTKVEYINTECGAKENIILDKFNGKTSFDFLFQSNTLHPVLSEDVGDGAGMVYLVENADPENVVYRFSSIYAYDSWRPAQGKENESPDFRHMTEDCHYSLTQMPNGYKVTVHVSRAWLTNPAVVYPVIIDPTYSNVSIANGDANVEDLHFSPGGTKTDLDYLQVGKVAAGQYSVWVKFKQFDAAIPWYATAVNGASVVLTYRSGQTTGQNCKADRVTASWSESTTGSIGYITTETVTGAVTWSSGTLSTMTFNITAMAQKWRNGTASNQGVRVQYATEVNDLNSWVASEGDTRGPKMSVTYTTPDQMSGITNNQLYYIKSAYSSKYITASGTDVLQYSFNGGTSQQWKLSYDADGFYYFTPMSLQTHRIDLPDYNDNNGINLKLHTSNGSDAQKYTLISSGTNLYRIQPKCSKTRVMDVEGPSTSDGAPIQIWEWGSLNQQRWYFEQVKTDLYPSSFSVTAPSSGGTEYTLSARINCSNLNASASLVKFEYYWNSTWNTIGSPVSCSALSAGGYATVTQTWTPPVAGSYSLRVTADSGSAVSEFYESNNISTMAYTAYSGLSVSAPSVPSFLVTGKSYTVSAVVSNLYVKTPATMVKFEAIQNGVATQIGLVSCPELNPNTNTTAAFTWIPTISGTYSIRATVDPGYSIPSVESKVSPTVSRTIYEDVNEPANDSDATAAALTLNSNSYALASSQKIYDTGDVDWFSVAVPGGKSFFEVQLSNPSACCYRVDVYTKNSSGSLQSVKTMTSEESVEFLRFKTSGNETYYIKISGNNYSSPINPYSLNISAQ